MYFTRAFDMGLLASRPTCQREKGAVQGMSSGAERVAYVSRDDLAAALAGALVSEGHAGAI